ncbi:MAG TPA: hypothetical protein VL654_09695 [Casimicrobiaceae bacterium]|jgi:hypothetical protein|nr:hypothetical protein [Casimicrobiaceae bacterium]
MNDALSGSLDVASGGLAPPVILWDKTRDGLDVRMIAAMVTAPLFRNTTNPRVHSVKDFTASDRNADKRAAAQLYVTEAKSKEPVDDVCRMLTDPEIEFTLTPRQVGSCAQFMYEDGLIKHRSASWKDLFFDAIHRLPGS